MKEPMLNIHSPLMFLVVLIHHHHEYGSENCTSISAMSMNRRIILPGFRFLFLRICTNEDLILYSKNSYIDDFYLLNINTPPKSKENKPICKGKNKNNEWNGGKGEQNLAVQLEQTLHRLCRVRTSRSPMVSISNFLTEAATLRRVSSRTKGVPSTVREVELVYCRQGSRRWAMEPW